MTIAAFASNLASRLPAMRQDSPMNLADGLQLALEELFQQVTEQRDPALRSRAERELEEVEAALKTYPLVPRDTWIGDNSTDDRVLWLIRRLIGTEAALRELREAAKEIAP